MANGSAACRTTVTISGIPSARKKLERAKIHLDALRREMDAFREDSPYDFAMESPGERAMEARHLRHGDVTGDSPVHGIARSSSPTQTAVGSGDVISRAKAKR